MTVFTKSSRCLKGRNSGFGATSRNKQDTHTAAVKSVNIVERGIHMPMHEVVAITYREREEGCTKGRDKAGPCGFSEKPYFQFHHFSMVTYWSCSINPNYDWSFEGGNSPVDVDRFLYKHQIGN